MKKSYLNILAFGFFMIITLNSTQARADCANPVGVEGEQIYNTTHSVMQYCDGTDWTAMRGGGGSSLDDLTNVLEDSTTDFDGEADDDDDNLFIGHEAASLLGTADPNKGARNIAIGVTALSLITEGDENVALGYNSLQNNTTGSTNTAVGTYALKDNTIGSFNTAIGRSSLSNNIDGNSNVAIGLSSMTTNSSGTNNTAVGSYSLRYSTTSNDNSAFGYGAMMNNLTGTNNTGIGRGALQSNTLGNDNTALGEYAMRDTTIGSGNTAIGQQALGENIDGDNNVALGFVAGRYVDGGGDNLQAINSVFIGRGTRANASGQTNQIVIGEGAIGLGSNTVLLGNSSITTTALRGNVGIGTDNPTTALTISTAVPRIQLTDTDTNADTFLNANSSTGGFAIIADVNNEAANTSIVFNIDGAAGGDTKLQIKDTGIINIIGITGAAAPTK